MFLFDTGQRACKADAWADGNKAGEVWAITLSEDGQYLAATSFNGRINVWDNLADGVKIREFETKGSFGMSIDLVRRMTSSEERLLMR